VANEVLQTKGSKNQIVFADHAGDFGPTAANDIRDGSGSYTNVELDLVSLADAAARQSAQVDFGTDRAPAYYVKAALEMAATPTAGDVVEFYMAWSDKTGEGWPGGVSDGDAAYSGYSSNLADSVKQLDYIGSFVCTVQITTTVQIAEVGIFQPKARYGVLIVKNESAAAVHTDDVECHVVFTPIIDEVQ